MEDNEQYEKKPFEELKHLIERDVSKSSLKLFGQLYNFLYKEVGTGKMLYVKPIFNNLPEQILILSEYFELDFLVDKENPKEVVFIISKAFKDITNCSEMEMEE